MEDDVKQAGADRYALSQAYRWRAERDKAMQELARLRDRSRDTTVSAYDLLPEEDREAVAWVREYGGIEKVRRDFRDAYNRRTELCAALGIDLDTGWSDAMAEMDRRLMPEGMEWPRYEDGEPVKFGDMALIDGYPDIVEAVQLWIHGKPVIYGDGGSQQLERGERVKRPAPKVLDADGVEIRVGDTVYYVDGREQKVNTIARLTDGLVQFGRINEAGYVTYCEGACISPDQLTHRAPVLAADGRPLREGETVRHKQTGRSATVKGFDRMLGEPCAVIDFAGIEQRVRGALLTHERPEFDSWSRLEEDAKLSLCEYNLRHKPAAGDGTTLGEDVRVDLVRRARALAEKEG